MPRKLKFGILDFTVSNLKAWKIILRKKIIELYYPPTDDCPALFFRINSLFAKGFSVFN